MDMRLLRAFLTVADEGNFGRAADRLSITQPALTKQVQALETQVSGRLFDRGRQGAVLTDLGRLLLPDARDVVARAEAFGLRAAQAARGEAGTLSVGFGLSSIELAPRAVAAFRLRYPTASIVLDDMSSKVQIERILADELHVGFVRLPVDADLEQLALQTDRLALAAPRAPGPLPRLDEHPVVQLARTKGPGLVAQIERYCAVLGVTPNVVQEAHDLQTVLALVAAGVGVALVPASAARIAPPSVRIAPIRRSAAAWQVGAVFRAAPTPMTSNFLAVLREVV